MDTYGFPALRLRPLWRAIVWLPILIISLLPLQAAGPAPTVSVFVTSPGDGGSEAQHRGGDAILPDTRYRIQISAAGVGPFTVRSVSSSGNTETLFSGDLPTGATGLELPPGGGWYTLPSAISDVRLIITQNDATTEHVMHIVDSSLPAYDKSTLETKQLKRTDFSPDIPVLLQNTSDIVQQVSLYRETALKLGSAKVPLLRGGQGARVFREAAPGVVLIVTGEGLGSGIVLNGVGQILTNWHVVQGASSIGVILKPPAGQRLRPTDVIEAKLIRYDEVADLAVIELEHPPSNLVPLKLGEERTVEVGSTVHAIGHPSGDYWTYTEGVISQLRPDYTWTGEDKRIHTATVIQTQTPINPGNSGGPLLDDNITVLGINSFSEPGKQGLNFAIGVGDINRFLASAGNRAAKIAPDQKRADQPPRPEGCKPQEYAGFVDQKTQKWVTPIDTECSGKPNLYLVSDREGDPAKYALVDQVGDGKIDVKIVYKFDGKADLWIFYGRRDGIPTAFGYDYGSGKLERVIPLNAAAQ